MAFALRIPFLLLSVILPMTLAESASYTLSSRDHYLLYRPSWVPTSMHGVNFRFRTANLDALLLHITNDANAADQKFAKYSLIVKLTNGRIRVTHVHSDQSENFSTLDFVADNKWHTLRLQKDPAGSKLRLTLDNNAEETFDLKHEVVVGGAAGDATNHLVVSIGGTKASREHYLLQTPFHGCIHGVSFDVYNKENPSGQSTLMEMEPQEKEVSAVGCNENRCAENNPCQNGGKCFDNFESLTCDCSGTGFKANDCSIKDEDLVTLKASQYIEYDAQHSSGSWNLYRGDNKLSFDFKTTFQDGVLFHAHIRSSNVENQDDIVTAFIQNQRVRATFSSKSGGSNDVVDFRQIVSDGGWHTISAELTGQKLRITVDSSTKESTVSKRRREVLLFTPNVTVGWNPESDFNSGEVVLPFVGCIRNLFHGPVNVIEEMQSPNHHTATTRNIAGGPTADSISQTCSDIPQAHLSVALLNPQSSVVVEQKRGDASSPKAMQLEFRLGGRDRNAGAGVLASGKLTTAHGEGSYRVLVHDGIHLEVNHPDANGQMQQQHSEVVGGDVHDSQWHLLEIQWPARSERRKRQDADPVSTEAVDLVALEAADAVTVAVAVPTAASGVSENATILVAVGVAEGVEAAPEPVVIDQPAPSQEVPVEAPQEAAVEATGAPVPVVDTIENEAAVQGRRMQGPGLEEPLENGIRIRVSHLDHHDQSGAPVSSQINLEPSLNLAPTGPLHLGASDNLPGASSCIRNVQLDSRIWDVRRALEGRSGESGISVDTCSGAGRCQDNNPCEHGAACLDGVFGAECKCQGTGYTGKTCHLPEYGQSCTDLYLAGERRTGVQKIDLDGSGPMPPVHVYCNMSIHDHSGVTKIDHNFRAGTQIQNGAKGGVRYDVQYRQLDKAQLKKLVDLSKQCRQFISYKCQGNPLKLGTHTWFHSVAENGNITSFGSDQPGKCACHAKESIICALDTKKDLHCNCDADDQQERVDDGYFSSKEFVGITNMTFVNRKSTGSGSLTLGPLECFGKEKAERTVSFTTDDSFLEFPALQPNEDISFFFRTSSKHALLFHQPANREVSGSASSLRLALTNATTVTLYISISGKVRELTVSTPKPLSNAAWHPVKVEFGSHEVRLTVDLSSAYLSWNSGDKVGQYGGSFYLGGHPNNYKSVGAEPGLVGCIQGLSRGPESVDLTAAAESASLKSGGIKAECQSSCTPNPCANNAECFDKFGDYECICANPVAHSGKHCERNINEKAVTFINSTGANYIFHSLLEFHPEADPLTQNIKLSFRTHNPTGILFYAYDHFNNFIQLHLENGRSVILTLNFDRQIRAINVTREYLNDGRWHQIHVSRGASQVTLGVDFEFLQSIDSPARLLSSYSWKPWGRETPRLETIVPPRTRQQPRELRYLFIGGVDKQTMQTGLLGWYGCLRGVAIGETVLDLAGDEKSEKELGVIEGCDSSCDKENPCHHGGFCINKWGDSSAPVNCDCTNSSFAGATCTDDIGAQFDGSSYVFVEYRPQRVMQNFDMGLRSLSYRLAFSAAVAPEKNVSLLDIQFNDKIYELVVLLSPEGEVSAQLFNIEGPPVRVAIRGNFIDSHRHAVQVFTSNSKLTLQVDRQEDSAPFKLQAAFIHRLIVGSVADQTGYEQLKSYGAYTGCLSNVRIDSLDRKATLEPLRYVLRRPDEQFVVQRVFGTLAEGTCGLPLELAPTLGPHEEGLSDTGLVYPPWLVASSAPVDLAIAGPQSGSPMGAPVERNIGMIVGIVCGIFLLIVLIAVLIYVIRLRKRKGRYDPNLDEKPYPSDDSEVQRQLLDKDGSDRPIYNINPKVPPSQSFDRPVSKFIDDHVLPSSQVRNPTAKAILEGINRPLHETVVVEEEEHIQKP